MAVLSSENVPTVAVVGVVLGILGIGAGMMNTVKISQTATAIAGFEVRDAKKAQAADSAATARIAELEARLAKLEAAAAAAPAPAPTPAAAP
ncbi:MAG: hypothetical protein KC621_18780 [Myxococcales bacterium]|nr:hypothetical protein [Myxococcales bacterium]